MSISIIVSIIALLFSFGTTFVSYKRTKAQDIENLRSELRGLLQRLALLPKDNFELNKKYVDDPEGIRYLSSLINQENALLARQAAQIAKKLPKDLVSATEYYAIGVALQNSYNNDGAIEFQQLAVKASNDFNDEIAALRMHADLLFLKGEPETGRVEYQKALNVFSRYKGFNEFTQKSTHIFTELNWATSEANSGFINLANQHIATAEDLISNLAPSPGTELLRKQISQKKSMFNPKET